MLNNRIADIDKLIQNLDITPAMFVLAKQRYEEISNYFTSKKIEASFYPQGSFRLGTVIRPLRRGQDSVFDLDFIGELNLYRDDPRISPACVKEGFGKELAGNPEYKEFLQQEDARCWTLLYSSDNFSLDMVPAVHETDSYIASLINRNVAPNFAQKAIAITNLLGPGDYEWNKSNPEGYAMWFDEINEPYLQISRETHRKAVLNESNGLFTSIEEIPAILDRSALQRVIQILKRHRDVYFSDASKADATIWDYRPASVIITTLCAEIARACMPTGNVLELLYTTAEELRAHSQLQRLNDSISFEIEHKRAFIRRNAGKWSIKNPVNPDDDYTDCWTSENAKWFFRWLDAVIEDFFVQLDTSEACHYSALKKAFGKDYVEMIIPESKRTNIQSITTGTQPYLWRRNG